jgi:GNAT superfamily N-acetyltransferase
VDLDRLLDRSAALILSADAAVVPSVAGVLARRTEFRGVDQPVTGMLLASAADLRGAALPAGLRVRATGADGVPLEEVAAACRAADPGVAAAFDDSGFAAHLRRAPDADLLAAVDEEGRVRGTAASAVLGGDATVYLVSTDAAWRGRGVASALTAAVVRRAFERGAESASLEASAQGRRLYERLGFRPAVDLRSWIRVSG